MHDVLYALTTGVIQGLTEFLPISSSAHLVLFPYIFNLKYEGLAFDTALHFGTVIAIVAFFWRDWLKIIRLGAGSWGFGANAEKTPDSQLPTPNYPKSFLWQIIIATIPAAIAGFLLQDLVESKLHSPLLLAINLAVFGIILWLVDHFAKRNFALEKIGFKQSLIVGVAQSLALIPGISRSGITMVASRGIGLERDQAARFSFMLGAPAMIGAFFFELRHLPDQSLSLAFIVGILASAVSGLLAIKFLLIFLKKSNFSIFVFYRIALALFVIGLFLLRR